MANSLDTVTIALSGSEVSLEDFAKTINNFFSLIKALTVEANGEGVDWIIYDLQISSAVATVRGLGERERVQRVIHAYTDVGTALVERTSMPFSKAVYKAATGLTSVLRHQRVEAIRFETAEREIIVRSQVTEGELSFQGALEIKPVPRQGVQTSAFGSVEGRVQTLTNRGGLRFNLYDLLNDKAVSCYLKEDYEGIMRDAWGKLAVVIGVVSRDPLTGRPLSVRQVSDVIIRPEITGTYRDARGVSPAATNLSPEAAIRKLRDA